MTLEDDDTTVTANDSSDFSDTSSSSMDVTMSDEDVQKLMELEQRLEESGQLDTLARKEYLETLRRCGMKEKLRDARYALNAVLPLNEAMWLEWVQDESEAVACAADVVKLEELLQKSHCDCVSVSLWKEHIEVAKVLLSQQKTDVASVRSLFEDAISQCGLHIVEGNILWDAYLDFEMSLGEGDRDDERIRDIFSRFLQTPFPPDSVECTKKKLKDWLQEIPHTIMKGIERAHRAYSLRHDYEGALTAARSADPQGVSLLSVYYSYINLEISGGIHARVRMMFERALADFPGSDFLWKNVLTYEESVGRYDQLPNLQLRAIRHCSWSGDIWSIYMRQKSKEGQVADSKDTEETLDSILERALANLSSNPMECQKVILARALSIKSMKADNKTKYHKLLRDGIRLLKDMNIVDPDHQCATLLSHSLALGGDVGSGKAVWESLLSDTCIDSQYSGTWLSYYNFLEQFVDNFTEARDVFKRSITGYMSLADHAYLIKTWLMMEQKRGTQESYYEAVNLTSGIQRKYEASQLGIDSDFQDILNELSVPTKERDSRMKLKRKRMNENKELKEGSGEGSLKSKERSMANKVQVSKHVVFMKHIVPSVTEKDIIDEFASCGDDMDVTIGRDPKTDRSKGYAYIRCGSKQTFDNLCALDGREFHGRSLFIAPSAPPKGKNHGYGEHREALETKERSQKQRLAPATEMIPRATVVGAPKSNDDFRKMFLSS